MVFHDLFTASFSQASPESLDPQQERILTFDPKVLLQIVEQSHTGTQTDGINLTLFPDVGGPCVMHKLESPKPSLYLWHGLTRNGQKLSANLAFSVQHDQDAAVVMLAGHITANGKEYRIDPAGDMQVRVSLSPPAGRFCCNTVAHQRIPSKASAQATPDTPREYQLSFTAAEQAALISICAFYPAAAVKEHLKIGLAEIELAMLLVQEDTNTIFANSKIPARVHIEVRPFINEPKNIDTQGLLNEAASGMGALHTELTAHLAEGKTDIIALLAVQGTLKSGGHSVVVGQAGDTPTPPDAVKVEFPQRVLAVALKATLPSGKHYDLLSPDHAFAHELGHLLGARHSEHEEGESTDISDDLYGYVRGYIPVDKSFWTVMAYSMDANPGAKALPIYSDHEQSFQGQPVGIPPGLTNAASAAPFLRWSAQEVSRYKTKGLKSASGSVVTLKVVVWGIVDRYGTTIELKGSHEAEAVVVIPRGVRYLLQHSRISVIVAPREGIRLDHWKVDGVVATEPVRHMAEWSIPILMDKSHVLDIYFDIRANIVLAPQCQPAADIELSPESGTSLPRRYLVAAGHSKSMLAMFTQPHVAENQVVEWQEDGIGRAWGRRKYLFELSSTGPHNLKALVKPRDCKLTIERIPIDVEFLDWSEEPKDELLHGAARGQRISLEYPDAKRIFDHWEINGQTVMGRQDERKFFHTLDFLIERDTDVRLYQRGYLDAVAVAFEFIPPLSGPVSLSLIGEQNPDILIDLRRTYFFSKNALIRLNTDSAKRYGVTHWAAGDGARVNVVDPLTITGKQLIRFFRHV